MGKLVRDLIAEIIAADDQAPAVRILNELEHDAALLNKLDEEVAELRHADPHHRVEEAADVYEVLLGMLARQGIGAEELASSAAEKRRTRGGFTQRWWWEPD